MPDPERPTPGRRDRGEGSGRRRLRSVDEISAGGLVIDGPGPQAQAALIARTDRRGRLEWVLPKGHLEVGETAEAAAVREVAEETGLQAQVVAPLGTIDYWFVTHGRRVHKVVHHYLLRATGGELSDADAEVTAVEWVPVGELAGRLRYDSERRLLDRLPDLLAGSA